jgi:hypothetical protein
MNEEKNLIVALVLSIFIGMGNVYNGLVKRGLFELIVGILFIVLANYSSRFYYVVCAIWLILALYDTYLCNKAINNNEEIPKFLGKFDIQ